MDGSPYSIRDQAGCVSGFYLMHRGWQDNPLFGREPFSRRDAWVWLIENAVHKPTRISIGGKGLELHRGQLSYSLRYLAKQWGWDDPKVRRFIAAAVRENMIDCVADAGQNVITISNYDKYQVRPSVADATPDAATTQERRTTDANKKEGKELKEDSDSANAESSGVAAPPSPSDIAKNMVSIWQGEGLHRIAKLHQSRVAKLGRRLRDSFGGDLERWRAFCQSIRGSPFLMGENDRGWKADLDWALKPASIASVEEGKYRGQINGRGSLSNGSAGFGYDPPVPQHRGPSGPPPKDL
jgi:hypothetical protein